MYILILGSLDHDHLDDIYLSVYSRTRKPMYIIGSLPLAKLVTTSYIIIGSLPLAKLVTTF